MTILLSNAGKRYNRDWIFRHLTYTFTSGNSYAIIGPNGSGKSTLLQAIAGAIALSEGILSSEGDNSTNAVTPENLYQYIAIAAPYLEVIEEMTATEFLHFHKTFKPLLAGISIKEIIALMGLANASNKQIRYYSSGMKQRVKLAQAIFSDVPVILLDEPSTNLDNVGIDLYQKLIQTYCKNKLVVVSSNDEAEYGFCREKLSILDFKNTASSSTLARNQ